MVLPSLRSYVKSHFAELRWSKTRKLTVLKAQNFRFLGKFTFESGKNAKKSKFIGAKMVVFVALKSA